MYFDSTQAVIMMMMMMMMMIMMIMMMMMTMMRRFLRCGSDQSEVLKQENFHFLLRL